MVCWHGIKSDVKFNVEEVNDEVKDSMGFDSIFIF